MNYGPELRRCHLIAAGALVFALAVSSPLAARTGEALCPTKAAAVGPHGFGAAGFLPESLMESLGWTYSWRYHSGYMYDNERFLPMVWGGPPPGDYRTWERGKYGITSAPGCANRTAGGCTDRERRAFAKLIGTLVAEEAPDSCGRTWLIFNEPDLPGPQFGGADSSDLDPVEAAKLYDEIVRGIREFDPSARFFCCGTVVREESFAWLETFLVNVSETIDGYHMHNYFLEGAGIVDVEEVLEGTIQAMIDFSEAFYDGRPIAVTESGNWGWPDSATAEQLLFMAGMADWLNTEGPGYGYASAAWFLSVSPYTAPCQQTEDDDCTFTTRVLFPIDGELTESVTGYHRAYNWRAGDPANIEPKKGNGAWLSRVAHYKPAGGPCEGEDKRDCSFETRTLFESSGGDQIESITAGGRYYNFTWPAAGGQPVPWSSNGSSLASVAHYAAGDGPCFGQEDCRFNTRTIFEDSDGDQIESITAGGRYYNFTWPAAGGGPLPWGSNGTDLAVVDRYAGTGAYAGKPAPCAGLPAGSCSFQTRSVYYEEDGDQIESITANHRFYNYRFPAGGGSPVVMGGSGSLLKDVHRYDYPPLFTALFYPKGAVDGTWRYPLRTALGNAWLFYLWGSIP